MGRRPLAGLAVLLIATVVFGRDDGELSDRLKQLDRVGEKFKASQGAPKAVIVLSMVGKTYRLTQDMKDAAAALHLQLAPVALTLKQIYADVPGQGAVVWDMGARGREAAAEVDLLFRHLLPAARKGHRARTPKPTAV